MTQKRCPECWGKIQNGKCVDCGWTPQYARVMKNLDKLIKRMEEK